VDNLTHTLTALAISHAGLSRKTRFATLTVIAGANLPDLDVVTWAEGTATYLRYHRGITHSFLGILLIGLAAGLIVYAVGRRANPGNKGIPLSAGWLLACGLIGSASHLLLDFTNAYGVRPFLPFSGRWYAWDIMFIVDPVAMCLLAAGLGVPALLRLISEEVGAGKPAYRAGAIFSLTALALLWGMRDVAHRRAVALLDSIQFRQENPRRIGVFPSPVNPMSWIGVAETDSAFYVIAVSVLEDRLHPGDAEVFHKPEPSPSLDAATKSVTGTTFLDFSRFPWGQVQDTDDGYAVTFRDLRFAMPRAQRPGFVMTVKLDKELRVRSESFAFRGPAGRQAGQQTGN
jgi:inner membrane protein